MKQFKMKISKQITKTREKNIATNKIYILRKIDFKFQNSNFNTL